MKALSKDPYRRYTSIQEFANALSSASQKPERTTEPFAVLPERCLAKAVQRFFGRTAQEPVAAFHERI